jgi:flagellar hook-associated protein 1
MSLNSIMNIATSSLFASQRGIRTVTSNVANVNTPGYVRVDQNQTARVLGGGGAGVDAGSVRRAADRFLQAASLTASSSASSANVKYGYLDSLQAAFGDPTSQSSIFGQLDAALGSFEAGTLNPGSITARRGAISDLQNFLSRLNTLGSDVQAIRGDVDRQIGDQVSRVNNLLADISKLNAEIQRSGIEGDASGTIQRQSTLIDELATFMDIRLNQRGDGTTEVRTSDGVILAGFDHATLTFTASGAGSGTFNRIGVEYGGQSNTLEIEPHLQAGSLRGLLDLRDKDLADIALGIGELAGGLADALNAAHNQNATLPPPTNLIGVDTGLVATDALNFKGKTTIALVDANGVLKRRIDVDFDLGTISVDGVAGPPTGTTIGSFQTALNTALGTMGSASFAKGKLELTATPPVPATGPVVGFAFDEPETGGSVRGSKAFAHFFGLNDLVRSGVPTSYATGMTGSDAHGFTVGATMRLAMRAPNGEILLDRSIAVPAGTVNDLMSSLNSITGGVGLYGTFGLDGKGQMVWTPAPGQSDVRMDVMTDVSPRGDTTRSFAQLFGISSTARETRATGLSLNPAIAADPRKLAFARPDLTGMVAGDLAVGLGDSRGAQALFDVTRQRLVFSGPMGTLGRSMTLGDYASSLGGDVGTRAGQAERDRDSATAFSTEATARRANVEGVNLDEELVKLTSYQQAYSAAARMIRAADEMYEALLNAI